MAENGKRDFRFGIASSANGLDLNQLLISHPSSTFFWRLENDILQLELRAGDILQVDRSLKPRENDIVVAYQDDEPDFKVLRWGDTSKEMLLWGVVVNCIRNLHI